MKKFLQQLLSDGEMPSTYRVAMFVVLVPVMVVWAVICIRSNQFILPDSKAVTLICSLFGGKALQSFAEARTAPAQNNNTQTP